MKNNYKKLRIRFFSLALALALLTAATGYGILTLLAGVFQESFSGLVIRILMKTGMEYGAASEWYARLFAGNKTLLFLAAFCVLLLVFFYLSLRRLTGYLDEISDALEKVMDDSPEPIVLAPELYPMAENLSVLRQRLMRREQQAAESEQKKNELVVYLAHDLKTPLTSVIAYLTMLDGHPDMDAAERTKYTHITLEKALRLEDLINEFFEITRFNLQDIVLEKKPLNLSILLEQLADESYGMLSKKQMSCEVDVEERLMISGDPDKLVRVFDNLLRNAAAYGYDGSKILIQARGGRGRITIIFMNEGPQIPQKRLEMIFEKFYRVDDGRSTHTGGAGLGLAISKQIVELHGGSISAASDSRNTRFIVSLPAMGSENGSPEGRAGRQAARSKFR